MFNQQLLKIGHSKTGTELLLTEDYIILLTLIQLKNIPALFIITEAQVLSQENLKEDTRVITGHQTVTSFMFYSRPVLPVMDNIFQHCTLMIGEKMRVKI